FQAEDGIRDFHVTGVQTCALPISASRTAPRARRPRLAWTRSVATSRIAARGGTRDAAIAGASEATRVTTMPTTTEIAIASPCTRSEERRVGKGGRVRRDARREDRG